MKKEQNYTLSTKHFKLRMVAFILVLIVAVGAFGYGFSNMGKMEPGYYEITESADKEALLYGNGITLTYLFTGESDAIKEEKNRVEAAYSAALNRAYKLLDADNHYEGYQNIAVLNENVGQDVEVSDELYAILKDAYEKTLERQGYNMFAGAFYAHWNEILILEEPAEFDPLLQDEEAGRLSALAEKMNTQDNFALAFSEDGTNRVRLEVSQDYIDFCRENEEKEVYIDLNLLHDAYLMEIVVSALENAGYSDGFMTTDSGLTVSLSGLKGGEYSFYSLKGNAVSSMLMIAAEQGSVFSEFRNFAFSADEDCFYTLAKDGELYYRSPYVMADEEGFHNIVLSSCVVGVEKKISEAVYRNIQIHSARSREQLEQLCAEQINDRYAYTLVGDPDCEIFTNME